MLISLHVRNFLSIYEEVEFDFGAKKYGAKKDNLFELHGQTLSKSNIIYGANGSGKTTFIKAMWVVWHFTVRSVNFGLPNSILAPFQLNEKGVHEESFFEVSFLTGKRKYIYSFSLFANEVKTEKLVVVKSGKNVTLFNRIENRIVEEDISFSSELDKGRTRITSTSSVIAVLKVFNGMLEGKPIDFFFSKINIVLAGNVQNDMTLDYLKKSKENRQLLIDFLQSADFNIDDIRVSEIAVPDELLSQLRIDMPVLLAKNERPMATRIEIGHKNVKGEICYIDLDRESSGTQRLFQLFGFVMKAISQEEILIIDEVEMHLHPHVLKHLFSIIHADLDRNYQMIFTTHNQYILDLDIFRKEQIKFTKKINGQTSVDSLFNYADIRAESDVRKAYNQGSFGAIPENIRDFTETFRRYQSKQTF